MTFFAVLTGCYAVVVIVCLALRQKLKPLVWEITHFLMVIAALIGLSILFNAADHGGHIVHQYGIHAPLPPMHETHEHSLRGDDD
jgi:hypothetical protein